MFKSYIYVYDRLIVYPMIKEKLIEPKNVAKSYFNDLIGVKRNNSVDKCWIKCV